MKRSRHSLAAVLVLAAASAGYAETTEFCLEGEFDLGARYQGMSPQPGEFYPARWCVTTDDESERALLSLSGRSNPDMHGAWTVAFIPPDLVRIVNDGSTPDVEFRTAKAADEASRSRLLDPRHSDTEGRAHGQMMSLQATVDLPLRGRVPLIWQWDRPSSEAPAFSIEVDGHVVFRGTGIRRSLDAEEAALLWAPTSAADPIQVPGDRWPSRVNMQLVGLTDGVYVVRGVRTGFHHMVIETAGGLVVADAPAGWVELHQFPPQDMVPGLGVSGLSQRLIDFLADEFPDAPIRAVALTHHHDDHAGGARAFAAAGADVYAPAETSDFLEDALNRDAMPPDRLSRQGGSLNITPVDGIVTIDDPGLPVRLMNMGESPHVISSLGVLAGGVFFQSDLHVPNSDADKPRAERAATECWFARWAVENLPADTIVINTHSAFETPVSRLASYLESDLCSGTAVKP